MRSIIPSYFCSHADSFHSNLPRIWKEVHCLQAGEGRKVMGLILFIFPHFYHCFGHLHHLKYSTGNTADCPQTSNSSLFPLVCSAWKCLSPVSLSLGLGCGHSTGTRECWCPFLSRSWTSSESFQDMEFQPPACPNDLAAADTKAPIFGGSSVLNSSYPLGHTSWVKGGVNSRVERKEGQGLRSVHECKCTQVQVYTSKMTENICQITGWF